jgi:hypothetical protein
VKSHPPHVGVEDDNDVFSSASLDYACMLPQ